MLSHWLDSKRRGRAASLATAVLITGAWLLGLNTTAAAAFQGAPTNEKHDDAWYLIQLLALDRTVPTAAWMTDVFENPKRHPLIRVEFADDTPFVFVTRFDFTSSKIVIKIDRAFIRDSDPNATLKTRRELARMQFVREATLAALLEPGQNLETYGACAHANDPYKSCFDFLLDIHLTALYTEWEYASERDLARVFPESVNLYRDALLARGASFTDATKQALAVYGLQGPFRNLFWAERYERFMDELAKRVGA